MKQLLWPKLLWLGLVAGCTREPQAVPDASEPSDGGVNADSAVLGFCPTTIDVFGYSNVMNQGCGGVGPAVANFADGLFSPGVRGYDATLAGRLQARVATDPELSARFGTTWKIRSCSVGGGTMATFVATEYDPGDTSGRTGRNITMCTSDPAPLYLYSANNVTDTFHGGGAGTITDDPDAYVGHWADRFEEFRTTRTPKALLASPQHEWHGEQGGAPGGDIEDCTWQRPSWNRAGMQRWRSAHPSATEVVEVGDLQDVFKQHHSCCAALGVTCAASWFDRTGDEWVHFNCDGADALEVHWFAVLKEFLLSHEFACP